MKSAKEKWLPIVGFEGLYEVSDYGNVRSMDRVVSYCNNGGKANRLFTGKPIANVLGNNGYYFCNLWKNGKIFQKRTSRLVAEAFIPNPDNLPCVNHKNRNPLDNRAENLEWCTVQYNNTYDNVHIERGIKERNRVDCSKPICGINNKTGERKVFPSSREAGRFLGDVERSGNIRKKAKIRGYAYGYYWGYI